jgi:hypothetical protein
MYVVDSSTTVSILNAKYYRYCTVVNDVNKPEIMRKHTDVIVHLSYLIIRWDVNLYICTLRVRYHGNTILMTTVDFIHALHTLILKLNCGIAQYCIKAFLF